MEMSKVLLGQEFTYRDKVYTKCRLGIWCKDASNQNMYYAVNEHGVVIKFMGDEDVICKQK